MPAPAERITARLRQLQASVPDIQAAAVVSMDGLIIASVLPPGVEEDRVSAMSAPLLALGERILAEFGRGALDQLWIQGEGGLVVLIAISDAAVLTALTRKEARLGMILLALRRAATQLSAVISDQLT